MSRYQYSPYEIEVIKSQKEKKCTRCGVIKNKNYFGKRPQSIDGRDAQCLECQRERQAIIRAERKNIFQ